MRRSKGDALFVITGCAGFIGSQVMNKLRTLGYDVCGIDDFSTGRWENIPDVPTRDVLVLDLATSMANRMVEAFIVQHLKPRYKRLVVLHGACPAYDANSFLMQTYVTRGVVCPTSEMLSATVRIPIREKAFVLLSSMARYEIRNLDTLGGPVIGYREDDPIGGLTPYGFSKGVAEGYTRSVCDRHGISFVILVPHNVCGYGQQYNNPLRNVAALWLSLIARGRSPVIHGTGEQKRSFTHWRSIEGTIIEILTNPTRYAGLVLNVGPGTESGITLNELADLCYAAIRDLTGSNVSRATLPPRYEDTGISVASMKTAYCDPSRYRMLFGACPPTDYDAMLREQARQILETPLPFDRQFLHHADIPVPAYLQDREFWR